MAEPGALTAPQLQALLDILIHHETYAEVQSFQSPEAIEEYGWPFVDRGKDGGPAQPHPLSSSPLLQLLLTRLVLGAPAARELSTEFWPVKFKGIMRRFGEADLSDSYDKGTLGTRKRLATAASTVHEAVTRGLLSGVSCEHLPDTKGQYNRENAEHLTKSWRDCICHLVYGDLIDEIFDQLAQTSDLESHSPALKAAVEYAILRLATFLHQVFVLSPEGPYLLKLIENVHRLVPYTMVGQTLRIGNAASMINGMSKLFLSKVSIGAISNWIGLTSNASDGMNLNDPVQRIVSLVLDWDAAEFRKLADKFKSDRDSISGEHMGAIDSHLVKDRLQRKAVQEKSIREQTSIIIAIFDTTNKQLAEPLTDRQHASCLEYYAAKLAIRDRERIVNVLCNSSPDLTTAIVLEALGALDPMIRVVHKNVDLRKHLNAIESFLTDFIKTTKSKAQENSADSSLLTVEDFVGLLQRNRHLLWAYLHDFCKGCPELRDTWKNWMIDAIKRFRQPSKSGSNGDSSIIDIEPRIRDAFNELADDERQAILKKIDAHSVHLDTLEKLSEEKMQKIVDAAHGRTQANSGGMPGPGVFASRWQALFDDTLITPSKPHGPLRCGKDVKGIRAARKSDNPGNPDPQDTKMVTSESDEKTSTVPPDVSIVTEALGPMFKRMVAELSRDGLPKA